METDTRQSADLAWMDHADEALACWGLKGAATRHLSLSENATFEVTPPCGSERFVLRLHRPGYRGEAEIESELAWLHAIADTGAVRVAEPIAAPTGSELCSFVNSNGNVQQAVLFEFLEGKPPRDEDFARCMQDIGQIAASLHSQSAQWSAPRRFERMTWNAERMFGATCDYGDWRSTEGIPQAMRETMERVERKIRYELAAYVRHSRNYGLIHSDLRPDNLMVAPDNTIAVLDFDDCGFSWFMFDVACTFSFEEANPDLEDMLWAYLYGYSRGAGPLADEDFLFAPTCFMARRLSMLAWVEFRRETPYAQQIHDRFIRETEAIANEYLDNRYLRRIVDMAGHRALPHDLDLVG